MAKKGYNEQGIFRLAVFLIAAILVIGIYSSVDDREISGALVSSQYESYHKEASEVYSVSKDDDPSIGADNSDIDIIVFCDVSLPECTEFHRSTFVYLKRDYVDTGHVRLTYRDLIMGYNKRGWLAAEATECADDQNKYWEMVRYLHNHQYDLTPGSLKMYADEMGLNQAQFDDCLDSREKKYEVESDTKNGVSLGITRVPTMFINGRKVSGVQPFELVRETVNEELAK